MDKNKESLTIVVAAFAGAFASSWINKFLGYPFPLDLLLIMISAILLFFIVRAAIR